MSDLNNALQESLIKMDKELKAEKEKSANFKKSIYLHLENLETQLSFRTDDARYRYNQILMMLKDDDEI